MSSLMTGYFVSVHCHVGSLESRKHHQRIECGVHCHVGSLESNCLFSMIAFAVHCHVGSLETPSRF